MCNSRKSQTWLFGLIALFLFLALCSLTYASQTELDEINYSIHSRGARWIAGETAVSRLLPAERKMRLGAMKPAVSPAEVSSVTGDTSSSSLTATAPATFDWRNYNGYNYVTPVRDQGNCGSCWAFATTAALESNDLIVNGIGALNLSEQILLSCSGAGSCSGGYIDLASNFMRDTGLPSESYFPYMAANGQCSTAATGWQFAASVILSWHWVTITSPTVDAIKNDLNSYGPLVTTMDVYTDFYYYSGGVYQYTSGSYQGGHAILIVGYDDTGQYFIVKNSWGSGWGESGYFRIAYSQLTNDVHFGDFTIGYTGNKTDTCSTPDTPSLVGPSNGATGVSTAPTLDWANVYGATSYDIQVCGDSGCSSVVMSAGSLTSSQWAVSSALNNNTTYYWRARANNTCVSGPWGGTWSFTSAAAQQYSISGKATTASGAAMSGVLMTLNGARTSTATTDIYGKYKFTGLSGGSYTIAPSKTGYSFTPANRIAAISGASMTGQNFTGTVIPTYYISGKVKTSSGSGVSGETMTLSGAANKTTTTDSYGYYKFSGLINGNYIVTPSKSGYSFTPTNRPVTVSGANMTGQNFTRQ